MNNPLSVILFTLQQHLFNRFIDTTKVAFPTCVLVESCMTYSESGYYFIFPTYYIQYNSQLLSQHRYPRVNYFLYNNFEIWDNKTCQFLPSNIKRNLYKSSHNHNILVFML